MSKNYLSPFDLSLFDELPTRIHSLYPALLDGFNLVKPSSLERLKTDIKETDTAYLLEVEAPGYKKEDIKIDLNEDVLTVSIETKSENEDTKDNYVRKERYMGKVSRSYRFENIDEDAVKAKYENGVLNIELPKMKKTETKKDITIE